MINRIAFAAALALSATAANAETITLNAPMAAASVHSGGIDMVVYYLEQPDHFQIVATYVSQDDPSNPSRMNMGFNDGDRVSFALPGESQVTYTFARSGDTVQVDADLAEQQVTALVE